MDHLFAISACRCIGMMEWWNNGILSTIFVGMAAINIKFKCLIEKPFSIKPILPIFYLSIIPFVSEAN